MERKNLPISGKLVVSSGVNEPHTIRQKLLAQKLSEFIRKHKGLKGMSMGRLLREVGYSKSVCIKPALITKTKSFQEIMAKVCPDDLIANKHLNLLESSSLDRFPFPMSMTDQEIRETIEQVPGCKLVRVQRDKHSTTALFYFPDNRVQLDTLKEINKVRNKYPREIKDSQSPAEIEEFILHIRRILPRPEGQT